MDVPGVACTTMKTLSQYYVDVCSFHVLELSSSLYFRNCSDWEFFGKFCMQLWCMLADRDGGVSWPVCRDSISLSAWCNPTQRPVQIRYNHIYSQTKTGGQNIHTDPVLEWSFSQWNHAMVAVGAACVKVSPYGLGQHGTHPTRELYIEPPRMW